MWLQKDQQFSRHDRNSHTWLYEPSLWPWTWRQQTNLLAWHSGLWWCITIPSLVTKGWAVEKISSRWPFTGILNLFCDLDLDHNRAIQPFHKTIQLIMMCHQTKFSCKRISSLKDRHILIIWSYTGDLDLEDRKPIFFEENLAHNDASPYQVRW